MKRKFVCGIVLCLAFALAGCGNSKEKQAVNYYQNELGLDREDAEELANELYGDDDEDDYIADAEPAEVVVEPLPEFLNSEWYDEKIQIYDMVFSNNWSMTAEDVRKIVDGSEYNAELTETFDKNGEVCLEYLMVDGKVVSEFTHCYNEYIYSVYDDFVKSGLVDGGDYYIVQRFIAGNENVCYDKASVEFADLETRDDVLAYLAANGFVEVETYQACGTTDFAIFIPESSNAEFADTPHYTSNGAQSITLSRMRTISETDEDVPYNTMRYSGGHLNLVDGVKFDFNTDGTINRIYHSEAGMRLILGEMIGVW